MSQNKINKFLTIMFVIALAIFQSSNSLSVKKSNLKEEKGMEDNIQIAQAIDKVAAAFTGGLSAPVEIGSLIHATATKVITGRIEYYMLKNESELAGCTNAVKNAKYPEKKHLSYVKDVIKFARKTMKNIPCNNPTATGFYPNCVIVLCANPAYGIAKDKSLCREDVKCKN